MAPRKKTRKHAKVPQISKQSEELFKATVLEQYNSEVDNLTRMKEHAIAMIVKHCEVVRWSIPATIGNKTLAETQDMNKSKKREAEPISSEDFTIPEVPSQKKNKDVANTRFVTPCLPFPATGRAIITPKVNLNSPLGLVRVPRQGELAVSVSGSPLMVSSSRQEFVNLHVPLKDGNIVSILPKPNMDAQVIREAVDDNIKKQLETLHSTLTSILEVACGNK